MVLCGRAEKYRGGGRGSLNDSVLSVNGDTETQEEKKKTCTQMGMHMHTSNGTSVRHWTSGLVKR